MRPVAALGEIHDVSQPISRQADLPSPGFIATIPPLADPTARRDVKIAREVRLAAEGRIALLRPRNFSADS
jgi:hypothetical protein